MKRWIGSKRHGKPYIQWVVPAVTLALVPVCGGEGVDGLPAESELPGAELVESSQHDEGLLSSSGMSAKAGADLQPVLIAAQTFLENHNQQLMDSLELTDTPARATVVEYLRALEARDANGILKLVPDDYDAAHEVNARLQRFGGAHANEAHIRITADISPEVLSASIRTTGPDGQELTWTENLFWRDGEWKLVLGGRHEGRPSSDIRRPGP